MSCLLHSEFSPGTISHRYQNKFYDLVHTVQKDRHIDYTEVVVCEVFPQHLVGSLDHDYPYLNWGSLLSGNVPCTAGIALRKHRYRVEGKLGSTGKCFEDSVDRKNAHNVGMYA